MPCTLNVASLPSCHSLPPLPHPCQQHHSCSISTVWKKKKKPLSSEETTFIFNNGNKSLSLVSIAEVKPSQGLWQVRACLGVGWRHIWDAGTVAWCLQNSLEQEGAWLYGTCCLLQSLQHIHISCTDRKGSKSFHTKGDCGDWFKVNVYGKEGWMGKRDPSWRLPFFFVTSKKV